MRMFRALTGTAGGAVGAIDAAIGGGLMLLLVFTPLAFGAVHQWAFTLMEIAAFALAALWMMRVRAEGAAPARMSIGRGALRRLLVPAALFALLLAVQLVPLPPGLLKVISPATYQLYAASLSDWPASAPFAAWRAAWEASAHTDRRQMPMILPPVGALPAARAQAAAPAAVSHQLPPVASAHPLPATPGYFASLRWRTLSIAPTVTWAGLIEVLACGAIFFLVLLYPIGYSGAEREAEARFIRWLVLGSVAVATFVALIGLAERAWWNGRILWFFVPHDWSGPLMTNDRASGPFINPDHFADYLAMALPLAVVGSLFPIIPRQRQRAPDLRLPCAVAATIIAAGILLSLSRGGWLVAVVSVTVALWASFKQAPDRAPLVLLRYRKRAVPVAIAAGAMFVIAVLWLIGPNARDAASARIGMTVASRTMFIGYKQKAWRDTLGMLREFPLFGVGLGCWPELFPHFESPPWIEFYYRQPENDYLQLLAETGVAGFALALWFAAAAARAWRAGAQRLGEREWPMFAAISAGLLAVMIQELFEFSLHTPANALLFGVMLALALRIALTRAAERPRSGLRRVSAPSRLTNLKAAAGMLAAVGLIAAAITQSGTAYPYDLGDPRTFAEAELAIAAHPGDARAHLALAAMMPAGAPPALRDNQLRAAVWLDPNDPLARDLYARSLFLAGHKNAGLRQIMLSVSHAPDLGNHYYLQPLAIPWLLPEEQNAISEGFRLAIAAHYYAAVKDLADFYGGLGRFADAAQLFVGAEPSAEDDAGRLEDDRLAGVNFARAQMYGRAESEFRAAIAIDPSDPQPYRDLLEGVMAPRGDVTGASAAVREGISNGADRVALDTALANVAHQAGDNDTAEAAMAEAFRYDPTFDSAMHLGQLYADEGKYDHAAVSFRRATQIDDHSAPAFLSLGRAEEGAFDYAAAEHDYARAMALAPQDEGLRVNYEEFQKRTAPATRPTPDP
ncbi:MAG TPA: O-antigen ligase family protein [Candidatus Binataceae bacterium]|nr:O-antigen ligase family protein [Candidatus Binataceae bacterium]